MTNLTIIIGAVITFGGLFVSLILFCYCFIRMEQILRSKRYINAFDFIFPFMIYQKFQELAELTKEDNQNYSWYINTLKKSLVAAPIIFIAGLLVMVFGKSL